MRKIIIILLTVSAYFFNLNCCQGHWLFPDGDRVTTKEKAIVNYFILQDIADTQFECSVCRRILRVPEWLSIGDILKELRDHLTESHPETIQLPKKAGSAKLTGQ